MSIGAIIKQKRNELNLTQKQLGQTIGVSQNTVSAYERELFYPNVTVLMRLAETFNCTMDELCGRRTRYVKRIVKPIAHPVVNIGESIGQRRKEQHKRRYVFSEEIGVNSATLSKWEKNTALPNAQDLIILAYAFNCTIDELCGRKL